MEVAETQAATGRAVTGEGEVEAPYEMEAVFDENAEEAADDAGEEAPAEEAADDAGEEETAE